MAKLARHVMTEKPACCAPETPLEQVVKLMVQHDCGEIPVELLREVSRDTGQVSR